MRDVDKSNRAKQNADGRPAPREVDDEIQFHLEMMTGFYERRGMPRDEARRAAERRFGDITRYREDLIDARRRSRRRIELATGLSALRHDLASAFRSARRSPGFALGVALTIALGVGANATMYGVIDRILLTPPPHIQNPESVKRLYVQRAFLGNSVTTSYITYPDYRDWWAGESFQSVAAFATSTETLGHGEEAQRVETVYATASFFPLLGVVPHQGRLFTPEDDVRGAPPVAVLGYEFWRRQFGASGDVIGRTLDLGHTRYTIVGIAPRGFTGVDLQRVDVWLPLHSDEYVDNWEDSRGYFWIQSIARMQPNTSVEAAADEATSLHRAGRAESTWYDHEARIMVGPIMTANGPQASDESVVARWLAGVSLIVLVIACANVANLLLAQGARRRREIAVRLALGVSRGRLVRQLLASSVLFALLGAVGALGIAKLGGDLVGSVLLPNVDWSLGVVSDRILLFTLGVAVLTGLAAGLVPAIQSSRSDLVSGLKDGGTGGSLRRSRTRVAFLIAQAALSVVLLVGAGLFVRSLSRVRNLDLGLQPEGLYVALLETEPGAADRDERLRIYENALTRLQSLPGVQFASAVRAVPFRSSISVGLRAEGLDSIPSISSGGPYINAVTPDYFRTVGLHILRGRGFSEADVQGSARVAVVGASMARYLWPADEALGKCLYIDDGSTAEASAGRTSAGGGQASVPCTEIVGIADNARRQEVIEDTQLLYYVPAAQAGDLYDPRGLLIRAPNTAAAVRASLRREIQAAEPSLRLVTVQPFSDFLAPYLRSWTLGATVFSAFGVLALVVAVVGLYSVLSFDVAQRRGEIGVRAALGASGGRLIRWVVVGGVRLIAVGVALGGTAAFFASQAIESLLYEVSHRDPVTYGLVAATLLGVAALASLIPALRTTRVAPSEALKAE